MSKKPEFEIGQKVNYLVGDDEIVVEITGAAQYARKEPCFLVEWLDTTSRPVSCWVSPAEIVALD